jgi:hypothetical protein
MKRLTPPAAWQRRLALVDTPALAIPGQQELTLALMELLVQVARQIAGAPSCVQQEDPHGHETDI